MDGLLQLIINKITSYLNSDESYNAAKLLKDEAISESIKNYDRMDYPDFMIPFVNDLKMKVSDWDGVVVTEFNDLVSVYEDYQYICGKLCLVGSAMNLREVYTLLMEKREDLIDYISLPSDPFIVAALEKRDLPF